MHRLPCILERFRRGACRGFFYFTSPLFKVFIELVEVLEGESPHTDFLRAHGEGMQHVAFSVTDIRQTVDDLKGEGLVPILEYEFITEQGGREFRVREVYLNSAEFISGSTVQLMEITPA